MIETFSVEESGYHPFLIRDGWQVAQLNFTEQQHIDKIVQLDVHLKTDEVFILLKGNAVLIAASIVSGEPEFEIELMKSYKTYNIPQNVWHNIAMEEGSEIIIIEKSNTHISDFEHLLLSMNKKEELKNKVKALFDSIKQ
jgi:mannose-6-phosphate isomerase-like protein (cupin superfamily)